MKDRKRAQPACGGRAAAGSVGAGGISSAFNHPHYTTKPPPRQEPVNGESFRAAMPRHISHIKVAEMAPSIEKCPKCGDTGELDDGTFCDACDYGRHKAKVQAQWWEKNKADVEAARRRCMEKLYGPCMVVPERYQGLTPQTLEALGPMAMEGKRAAIEAVTRWAKGEGDKPGLLLYGKAGRGKSVLGWWAVPQRGWGLWLTWPELTRKIQSSYSRDGDSEAMIEVAQNVPVLFLDDLGDPDRRGMESDDKREILFRIVNHRLQHCKPTFITTNLLGSDISKQFGNRIASRLLELCEWCNVGGVDLRMLGGP